MERVAYGHSLEAMLAAARSVLDASMVAELRAIGLDPKKVLPSYPTEVARQTVLICSRRLSPTLPEQEALRAFGRRFVERYRETLIGKALAAASTLLGPRRMLDRIAAQFRTANNYLETKVTHLAPGRAELWANDVAHPAWFEGIITAMLEGCGARRPQVSIRQHDERGALFDISWEA